MNVTKRAGREAARAAVSIGSRIEVDGATGALVH